MPEAQIVRVHAELYNKLKSIQEEFWKLHGVRITTSEASKILMNRKMGRRDGFDFKFWAIRDVTGRNAGIYPPAATSVQGGTPNET